MGHILMVGMPTSPISKWRRYRRIGSLQKWSCRAKLVKEAAKKIGRLSPLTLCRQEE